MSARSPESGVRRAWDGLRPRLSRGCRARSGALKLVPATIDQRLLFFLIALVGVGLVFVFSASSVTALERTHDKFFIVKQQARGLLVGGLGMLVLMAIDYRRLQVFAMPAYIGTIALLGILFIPGIGVTVNGATRWISIGGLFTIQPSEIAKISMCLFLANGLARNHRRRESFRDYLVPQIIALALVCLLIVLQKSLSTAALIFAIGFLMMTVAHPNVIHILTMAGVGFSAVVAMICLEPYRIRRILGFLDPWADPLGKGYQTIQSLMALGTGGISGVGIGQSVQKLDYLPYGHTDFIFAVLGEEVGLLGALLVLTLYLGLFWRGISIAVRAPDLFGMFLAFGITATIAVQAVINIAVSLALIPITGMPLPFVSYGRSSLVIALASMGILFNISSAAERENLSRMSRRWSTR